MMISKVVRVKFSAVKCRLSCLLSIYREFSLFGHAVLVKTFVSTNWLRNLLFLPPYAGLLWFGLVGQDTLNQLRWSIKSFLAF